MISVIQILFPKGAGRKSARCIMSINVDPKSVSSLSDVGLCVGVHVQKNYSHHGKVVTLILFERVHWTGRMKWCTVMSNEKILYIDLWCIVTADFMQGGYESVLEASDRVHMMILVNTESA